MKNNCTSRIFGLYLMSLFFCTQAWADTPYPNVSYECLEKENKLNISVSVSYPENSASLYEVKKSEKVCKLSSGVFRTVVDYLAENKCGLMSVSVTAYRDNVFIRKVYFGDMCRATGDEVMNITINGSSGEIQVKTKN